MECTRMVVILLHLLIIHLVLCNTSNGVCNNANATSNFVLIHGNRTIIERNIKNDVKSPFNPNTTILNTNTLPDVRYLPTIGNGHVATVVKNDVIFMNGLYNGFNITTHRAKIPAILINNVTVLPSPKSTSNSYSLDLARGMYIERHISEGFYLEMKMFAHRSIKQLIVTTLLIRNRQRNSLTLSVKTTNTSISEDLDLDHWSSDSTTYRIIFGKTKEGEYVKKNTRNVTLVHSVLPSKICVPPLGQQSQLFLVSVDHNADVAKEMFNQGESMFFNQTLESTHVEAWLDIWKKGRIDIEGDDKLAKLAYSSLYYIVSALPTRDTPDFVGLSPGDLAHGSNNKDYRGHVFWDQETWMYPPIQLLHSDIGKAIIKTRIRTLDSAKNIAKLRGYKGAMYPWESAQDGYDVTPIPPYFEFEQHITGDISFAVRQYLYLTRDTSFLSHERGLELVEEIAKFWESRVHYNTSRNMYEIYDVMPPDEDNTDVNNSAYTNLVARHSLMLPQFVGQLLHTAPNPGFADIANKLYIPFDTTYEYHPEFEGYIRNSTVKQADVILMGFPLMMKMPTQIRKNDLDYYATVTRKGPAMTWSMFAIGYLEINDKRASAVFRKQLENNVEPFNVWTEVAGGSGAVNFITGMGGFLQSLLFGYGGFRLYPERIDFNSQLPVSASKMEIFGIDYLGGSIDFSFTPQYMTITLTKGAQYPLKLKISGRTSAKVLVVGKKQMYLKQPASIIPQFKTNNTSNNNSNTHGSSGSDVRNGNVFFNIIVLLTIIFMHIM